LFKLNLFIGSIVLIFSTNVLAQNIDLSLKETDYDEMLSKSRVGFDESYVDYNKPGIELGPVSLRFTEFYPPVKKKLGMWVKVAKVPNIYWGSYLLLADLSVKQVLNKEGEDLLAGVRNKTIQQHLEDNNAYTFIKGLSGFVVVDIQ